MKKLRLLLILFLVLNLSVPLFAADSTIDGLTELAEVPAADDEFAIWDTSTASTKKVLYSNIAPQIGKNALINGAMLHAQRGASGSASFTAATTPANSDDNYLIDRWVLLSDGNDIVDVTQSTEAPVGSLLSQALDVETVNKKFGILQVIEQRNCENMIGSTVSLSFQAKVSDITKLDNIKAAVIAWDSTADTVTSDIVSAWGIEDTTPTLAANWTYENTPANLSVTASWARYTIENISVDTATTTNIGVFIWSDGFSNVVGKFLYITNVQLERNVVTTAYEWKSVGHELSLVQRYYCKSYIQTVVPGTNTFGGILTYSISGVANSDHTAIGFVRFPVPMIAAPSVTLYTKAGTSGKVDMENGEQTGTVSNVGDGGMVFSGINNAVDVVRKLQCHYTAEIEL